MFVSEAKRFGYALKKGTNLVAVSVKDNGWALMMNLRESMSGGLTLKLLVSNATSTTTIRVHQVLISKGRGMGRILSKCEQTNLLYLLKTLPLSAQSIPKYPNSLPSPKLLPCLFLTQNQGKSAPKNHPNVSKIYWKVLLHLQKL